ncbi:hypothetical protein SAMN06295912_10526 [Sphingomonas laterariae]|uniref:Outer membrane protein beta-barrel domain-containing protein n=1 Tax=Edaphosphingomonas laterariae TaxID=861865 RepID=A0A239DTL9_9SPHN|nr:hypothetical protein [Sphingomonas laterariae]SNS35461.1 hypothetical protein SAMN06295912_10526 [Sphingomonas laterariae]
MIRKAILSLAVLPLAAATPAFAGEAYIEATGGISWNDEETNAIAGVAVGYDFDITEGVFVGVEGLAEKPLADDTRVAWGIGGRIGIEPLPEGKAFAGLNWQSKDCGECGNAIGLGAGWEQGLTERLYAKIEYKRLFIGDGEPDANVGIIGIGMSF